MLFNAYFCFNPMQQYEELQISFSVNTSLILPSHVFLSTALREYPELHVQADEPGLLTQLCSHPPLLTVHSSMSRANKWRNSTEHFDF